MAKSTKKTSEGRRGFLKTAAAFVAAAPVAAESAQAPVAAESAQAPVAAESAKAPAAAQDWLSLTREAALEPDLPIIDPHHHFWNTPQRGRYLLPELLADIAGGHNIVATVFLECRSMYRKDGPAEMIPVGEVEF